MGISSTVATKPLLSVLGGVARDPPPVWLMRQAGRFLPEYRAIRAEAGSFMGLCLDPVRAAEVTLQPVRRFAMDAAILFADILVVPYGMGIAIDFREGEGPVVAPVDPTGPAPAYEPNRFRARVGPVIETVSRVAAALPAATTLIGFAGGPWTVATYMVEGASSREFPRAKAWAFADPEGFDRLIAVLTEATIDYLSAQISAGAEVVQL
ncbi:MAG: uroporphyrinogen decarboxylase family protein, partial [Alphaproteobacteria bacterium]